MAVQNSYTGHLTVKDSFEAGNMARGFAQFNVDANTVSITTVSGLSLAGSGEMLVFLTGLTQFPGDGLMGLSSYNISDGSSFEIRVHTTNDSAIGVTWFAYRKAS